MRQDKIILGNNEFETVVAVTPTEHQRGLMFKQWPPPIMSFPYDEPAFRKFWMKDTPSPLDIVFCNNKKIVAILKGTPMSLSSVGPDTPCDLVVELPEGMANEYKISVGDRAELFCSLKTISKKINYKLGKIF